MNFYLLQLFCIAVSDMKTYLFTLSIVCVFSNEVKTKSV
ncbi:hypothetical protein ymoll0001_19700 [Yersinia mollaretii ATCC 43969]|uniref:Uncharacterized protein n=1 Tax=Yersinia mollaretii (strain ATCC 43969 / DSM 18520 / CIP 103324 / CNY 7263 / WAIP 204) TaxID=349967 RepID=A0ABP2EEI4_YERMW|nr:hypothetical protein ymoll0001_19700 [Yersinia mollaretii ATCC 43969]